jgi:hypothetical protein
MIPEGGAPAAIAASLQSLPAEEIEALLLCSDGVEDPFYPLTRENLAALFGQLRDGVAKPLPEFSQPAHGPVLGAPDAEELLQRWLSFEKRGDNDDRTVVILHRLGKQV